MGQLVQDEAGQIFVDTGGGVLTPVSEEQAALYQRGTENPVAGAAMAANEGIKGLAQGLLGLGSDEYKQQALATKENSEALSLAQPMAGGAGQYLPQAVLGVTSMGAGVLPTMGVEGLLGAATTPENPLMGAAVGAGLGLAGELAPGAVGWAANKARNIELPSFFGGKSVNPLDEIPVNPGGMRAGERAPLPQAEPVPAKPVPASQNPPDFSASPPNMGPQQPQGPRAFSETPPSMAERVTYNLEREDAASQQVVGARMMEGLMDPTELHTYGVPTLPGQRALLTARAGDDAAGAAARDLMGKESAQASQPIGGQHIRNIQDAQQQAATNFLTRELDMPNGVNLTDPAMSGVFTAVGKRLDDIADEMGTVPLTQGITGQFDELLAYTTGAHKPLLERIIGDIQDKAGLNDGLLSGQQWQEIRTEINKYIKGGMRDSRIGQVETGHELMETMTKAMEDALPDASKEELAKLRKQYAIAMTLSKPGARNADGQVNPVSFYNNWKRPQSKKHIATDDIGRFMNTIVTLTKPRRPDSGTAGRLLEAAAQLPIIGAPVKAIQTARGL